MDKIIEYFKRRANSTFLVASSTFWAIIHWKGLVALFFVDQELIMKKYGLLKNEYIAQEFFGFHAQTISWELCYEVIIFFLPFILAYLYVWWLPKFITNPSYKKETEYKIKRRIIKLDADRKVEEAEAQRTKATTKKVKETTKLAEAKRELMQNDPQHALNTDYQDFKKNNRNALRILAELKRTIYDYHGLVNKNGSMSTAMLAVCHVNDLVDVNYDPLSGMEIKLTSKGKNFLKKYGEDKR